ncbi:MAG: type II secretion system protein M, partial [Planctomycetota bacterium]|nr:type II secretion system protein M [Planctomycetota bacterium]
QAEEKKELERRIEEAMRAVDVLTQILPNKEEVQEAEFMKLLKSFEQESGVKVNDLTPQTATEETGSGYSQHKYEIKMEGTFTQFVKFLHKLETHRRFFKVDSFDLSSPAEAEIGTMKSPLLSIRVSISTYTYE